MTDPLCPGRTKAIGQRLSAATPTVNRPSTRFCILAGCQTIHIHNVHQSMRFVPSSRLDISMFYDSKPVFCGPQPANRCDPFRLVFRRDQMKNPRRCSNEPALFENRRFTWRRSVRNQDRDLRLVIRPP